MSVASSLGLRPCFADLDALVPRVTEFGVTNTSAISEPGTATTTTAVFVRFSDDSASWTYVTYGRRRVCMCLYVGLVKA